LTSTFPAASLSPKKALSIGGIVGITIRSLAVFILAGLLIYMHRRQKKPGEILQSSQIPSQAEHSSYVAPRPGMSEANYPNMQKEGFVAGGISDLRGCGRFNAQGAYGSLVAETESHSSISPPINERTIIQPIEDVWDLRNRDRSKGISSWHTANSPGSPSPIYTKTHRIENGNRLRFVFSRVSHFILPRQGECDWVADSINSLYNPDKSLRPHEMPVTSLNVATAHASARPFSFTNSESGYKKDERPGGTL
jgi:hypothetical protein